jgi:quaternary ammonium compound-resistance protein SugE
MSGWFHLLVASAFEVAFALGLKFTAGFTRPLPSALTVLAGAASFVILSQALKTLPVGTGYAAWTGIGAVGAAVLGIALLGESRDPARLASLTLIVAGVIGLRLSTPEPRADARRPPAQAPATRERP